MFQDEFKRLKGRIAPSETGTSHRRPVNDSTPSILTFMSLAYPVIAFGSVFYLVTIYGLDVLRIEFCSRLQEPLPECIGHRERMN